jgi:hypothetical protein
MALTVEATYRVVTAVTALSLISCIGGQPVALEGAGPRASVAGLPFEWRIVLGWPNSTLAKRTPSSKTLQVVLAIL